MKSLCALHWRGKINHNQDKIILDLCGGTGSWSEPYKRNGYDVRVISLPTYDVTDVTLEENSIIFNTKNGSGDRFYIDKIYGILAAPPCTHFSFARTNAKEPRDLKSAMDVVRACLEIIWFIQHKTEKETSKKTNLKFWALENPNGMLKFFLGKPAFQFNPYDFGDNYKKNTYLWGWFNEPKKNPIKCDKPKFDKLATKEIHTEYYGKFTRQERRAITPRGFAEAFFSANK